MFAMYSNQEIPRDFYHTYSIYEKHNKLNFHDLAYKKYTVLMNTINQYDDIINNDMVHPEAKVIDKFVDRLHLTNTGIKANLKGSFLFSKETLELEFSRYIAHLLEIDVANLQIEREEYVWDGSTPKLSSKTIIYAMD
jgi:hypothetical protein